LPSRSNSFFINKVGTRNANIAITPKLLMVSGPMLKSSGIILLSVRQANVKGLAAKSKYHGYGLSCKDC
jgi:hypothetical protein